MAGSDSAESLQQHGLGLRDQTTGPTWIAESRPSRKVIDVARERAVGWPVRLRTDRLLIREPMEKDRSTVIEILTHPDTRAYVGGAVDYASRQALELSPLGLTWGSWAICRAEDDQMLGSISLGYDRGELELVYALLPEHVGHGYAREACRAVIDWASENLDAPMLIAVTPHSNRRSYSLLTHLGFTKRRGFEEFGQQQLLMELPLRAEAQPADPSPAPAD